MLGSLIPMRARFPVTFRRMERDLEELMGRFFPAEEFWGLPEKVFAPRVNVAESEKGYEVTMDLPGIDPKELTVEIREGSLWVYGEQKVEKEEKGKTFHLVERHYGAFRRVIPFELPLNREKVEAKYHEGVLKINLFKMPEVETKRIEVKVN
jgi:HSP20 family protein